ncbi:hypothetical protein BJV77DRAFT_331333 [Russula vinacea]|nr:hypothetical protein BJV77DRAFT_331333 [Russula vinacea]
MRSNGGGNTGTLGAVLQRESAVHSVALCSTHCTTEPPCTEVDRRARSAPCAGLEHGHGCGPGHGCGHSGMALGWALGSGLWPWRCRVEVGVSGGQVGGLGVETCLVCASHLRSPILHFHSPHSRTPHRHLSPFHHHHLINARKFPCATSRYDPMSASRGVRHPLLSTRERY